MGSIRPSGLAPGTVPPAHARPDEDRRARRSVGRRGCLPRRWWQTPPAVRTFAPTVELGAATTHSSTLGDPAVVLGRPRVPRAAAANQAPEPTQPADPLPSMTEPGAAFAWRQAGRRRWGGGERCARHKRRALTPMGGHERRALASAGSTVGAAAGRPADTSFGQRGWVKRWGRVGVRSGARRARARAAGRGPTRCVECRRAGVFATTCVANTPGSTDLRADSRVRCGHDP